MKRTKDCFQEAKHSRPLGFVLFSCGTKPEDNITGKWKHKNGSITEFLKDGTVIIDNKVLSYSFIDKDRIKISGRGGEMVFRVSFSGDELIVMDLIDGTTDYLKRIKS